MPMSIISLIFILIWFIKKLKRKRLNNFEVNFNKRTNINYLINVCN